MTHYHEFATVQTDGLALCGLHCRGDAIHVGIFWNSEGEKRIIHFQNGKNIPVQDFDDRAFHSYFFNPLTNFPTALFPSLSALAELISTNSDNGFVFNREPVIYNGGKFSFPTGDYNAKCPVEKVVNCAVFVIALLNTYDYPLLDWNSWPDISPDSCTFLDAWLDYCKIPENRKGHYYKLTKEVRGKHVIVCPDTESAPSVFNDANPLAEKLIHALNNPT